MRCLYCGKQLALLRRITGSAKFCSEAHRQAYQDEYNRLALSRLRQAQSDPEARPPLPQSSGTGLLQQADSKHLLDPGSGNGKELVRRPEQPTGTTNRWNRAEYDAPPAPALKAERARSSFDPEECSFLDQLPGAAPSKIPVARRADPAPSRGTIGLSIPKHSLLRLAPKEPPVAQFVIPGPEQVQAVQAPPPAKVSAEPRATILKPSFGYVIGPLDIRGFQRFGIIQYRPQIERSEAEILVSTPSPESAPNLENADYVKVESLFPLAVKISRPAPIPVRALETIPPDPKLPDNFVRIRPGAEPSGRSGGHRPAALKARRLAAMAAAVPPETPAADPVPVAPEPSQAAAEMKDSEIKPNNDNLVPPHRSILFGSQEEKPGQQPEHERKDSFWHALGKYIKR